MTDQATPDDPNKTNEDEFPPETDEDEQLPINTDEELIDYQTDGVTDQQEDILPPKPKLQPIIAPDMFPPPIVICDNPEDYPESYRANSNEKN